MVVVLLGYESLVAGAAYELNIRELLCSLEHVVLMTEGVGEDQLAACVCEFSCRIVALLAFRNACLDHVMIFVNAQILHGFLESVDEVEVIGGVLIVQADQSDLEFIASAAA